MVPAPPANRALPPQTRRRAAARLDPWSRLIRIWRDGGRVHLSVVDDGEGFDPDAVPRGHLGLIGMRQRVDLVGGELRVESRAGRGTTISASVPADEPALPPVPAASSAGTSAE